jgi:hypothetical protein
LLSGSLHARRVGEIREDGMTKTRLAAVAVAAVLALAALAGTASHTAAAAGQPTESISLNF